VTGDGWASTALLIGCLVLAASGLVARRVPTRRMLGLVAAWLGVFALAVVMAGWLM
jgi:hypothetical protein